MTSRDLDAVVIGAIGIDTNVYLYGREIDFTIEANFSQNHDYIGQAGGYSARLFKSIGKKTAFIGALGNDFMGDFIRSTLKNDGIETLWFTDPAGTNRSINLMYPDGRRKNFYDAKSAMDIRADEQAARVLFRRSRVAHFSIQNWCRYLLAAAREEGCVVSVDLQDIVDVNDAYRADFVKGADVIFFSAVNHGDPAPLMKQFLSIRPEAVMVSGMGAKGCALGTAEGIRYFDPVKMQEAVIDTNGAGDSLAVGFLAGHYIDGLDFDDAILRGQIAARYTCTAQASTDALITQDRLNELYRQHKNDRHSRP